MRATMPGADRRLTTYSNRCARSRPSIRSARVAGARKRTPVRRRVRGACGRPARCPRCPGAANRRRRAPAAAARRRERFVARSDLDTSYPSPRQHRLPPPRPAPVPARRQGSGCRFGAPFVVVMDSRLRTPLCGAGRGAGVRREIAALRLSGGHSAREHRVHGRDPCTRPLPVPFASRYHALALDGEPEPHRDRGALAVARRSADLDAVQLPHVERVARQDARPPRNAARPVPLAAIQ